MLAVREELSDVLGVTLKLPVTLAVSDDEAVTEPVSDGVSDTVREAESDADTEAVTLGEKVRDADMLVVRLADELEVLDTDELADPLALVLADTDDDCEKGGETMGRIERARAKQHSFCTLPLHLCYAPWCGCPSESPTAICWRTPRRTRSHWPRSTVRR